MVHPELQGAEMPIMMVSGPTSRSTPKTVPGAPGSPGSTRSMTNSYNPGFKKIIYFCPQILSTKFVHQFFHQIAPPLLSTHFSMCYFLLAGRSFCCAPREPHGQEFSIDSRSGFSACQSQSACRAHGVSWALQRDLYPWPRGFSCVFILKFLGYSDLGSSFLLPRLHEF